jgi:DNA-damage-inducible protein J
MAKTAVIHARTQADIKKQAENILKMLGLSTTEAINIFLCQVIINKGLPFEVKIPNKETIRAMKDTNLIKAENIEDLFKQLDL